MRAKVSDQDAAPVSAIEFAGRFHNADRDLYGQDGLREIERLTGERLRPRASRAPNATLRDLADKTRKQRGVGCRSASLYGWHSLRATFVVLAVEAGVPIETVQLIVGHSATKTTMEYFNPTAKHAAEQVRERMNATALGGGERRKAIGAAVEVSSGEALAPAEVKPSVDDLIASMSEDQRKELARKLLGL